MNLSWSVLNPYVFCLCNADVSLVLAKSLKFRFLIPQPGVVPRSH
jgi:hypothetical protein